MNSPSGDRATDGLNPPARRLVAPLSAGVVVLLMAALLANSMTKEVGRDEQMYCTAGVLLSEGELPYRDFAYPSQMPYHPLLLATLYRGLGTTHYLLVGRLVSSLADILVVLLILLVYRSLFEHRRLEGLLLGLAAAVLHVFNPLVEYAAGYAWNHDVVVVLVMLALWLFLTTDFALPSRFWRAGLMGALLTLATCMRVTTVLVEILFLAAILWAAGGTLRNRSITALPFSAAALIVAAWPAWVIAQAPQAFALNLFAIPALYGRWLHEVGITHDKLALTTAAFSTPGYLVLLVLTACLGWIGWRCRSEIDKHEKPKAILAALLPALFLLIAYIPPTMWRQYLAVPVPFLVVAFAYPLLALRRRSEQARGSATHRIFSYALVTAVLVSVLARPVILYRSVFLLAPEQWTPVRLHRTSLEMAAEVDEPGPVLTLGPLHVLEGGRDIYPQLACGSIIYRVADLMPAEARAITHTVGPESLDEMVQTRPPAAVLVGIEPPYFAFLEEPLEELVPSDWRRRIYETTLRLYSRP